MYKILQFKEQRKSINKSKSTKKSNSKKELFITDASFLKKEYKTEKGAKSAIKKIQANPTNKGLKFMILEKDAQQKHLSGCRQGEETDSGARAIIPCTCVAIELGAKEKLNKIVSIIQELSHLTSELSKLPVELVNNIQGKQ